MAKLHIIQGADLPEMLTVDLDEGDRCDGVSFTPGLSTPSAPEWETNYRCGECGGGLDTVVQFIRRHRGRVILHLEEDV